MRTLSGVGLDVIEIDRIRKLARRNRRFLSRVFTPQEVRYCNSKNEKWQHFAVRFAAKEAVWKALSRGGVRLKNISVARNGQGKPYVYLNGRKASHIHISLSHSQKYAAAVAVIIK
ncbi:MAG: holo-ACP synthase [Elusimicrobia bacterium]|nr:holo-ACP synthase [Elusimicrobiota bacterium]